MKETEHTTTETESSASTSTVASFNEATDHYQKIMGVPNKSADLNSMPRVLRWFAYFFYTVLIAGALLFLVSWLVHK
ncbi:hypothetical protein [Paenibacillus glycanilyticus]|uniref:Amino acid transporter n=1 Tax=Paenibacillus glycanilyticus TaxID=126569 RepID=A0ABQ6GJY1_9BACL|nr:hypothetical protein [Paenibacillus glycanilyticus]GLX70538.1 hypothetical protein MU1_48840 [Paenibacillus glycanilyticus]